MLPDDPLWYKDAIIYEVHVRAFHDSVGDGVGDFRGLSQKLDYLQDLGVTVIWLLPFYPSPLRDDGYDIAEYTSINPAYGSLADFQELLAAAHERGIRVVTELVLNHTSDQHAWFQRARLASPGSPERDFYVWSDTPDKYREARIIFKDFEPSNWSWDPVAKAYYWHRFYSHQPDLNFDNPAVWEAIFPVVDFWLGMGVDGMRLDAVPYLYEREGTSCENLPETHTFLKAVRRHIDERFPNRMLLSEANQWPEDAVAYFGAGDETHMAFHFPLMPRMFMSIHMEDRFPIIDILAQTPTIPENCQWCQFLRNHDELTLEMVTDEERDYMYRAYAGEQRARINLGIRRRLAPLLGNNRRRIELMNGLLFSLGTPVIYYGDEIGMGDNIYLGDRNGVRTPMQWSSDRNAGFSRANPQKLYLPITIDPEYHYEAVNVEAQQNNPNSLLWWMKRLIALRKRYQAFGRGTLEFLHPANRKILAFVRKYKDEQILVVANLSRFVQHVELDLSAAKGSVPVELFGRTAFPVVGQTPYPLSLGPHAFYWFELEPSAEQPAARGAAPAEPALVQVPVTKLGFLHTQARERIEPEVQKYFQTSGWVGAGDEIKAARFADLARLPGSQTPVFLSLIDADYVDGTSRQYCLPTAVISDDRLGQLRQHNPQLKAMLRLTGNMEGVVVDGAYAPECVELLLRLIAGPPVMTSRGAELAGTLYGSIDWAAPTDGTPVHASVVSQHTTSAGVAVADRLLLRVLRHVEPGLHPQVEIGRYLTHRKGFEHVAALVGSLEYRRRGAEPTTLAILHRFVANEGTAWQYTLDELSRFFERVLALPAEQRQSPAAARTAAGLAEGEMPPIVQELIGRYLDSAKLLGQRTAELHLALGAETYDSAFASESMTPLYQRSLYQSMRNTQQRTLHDLALGLSRLSDEVQAEARQLLAKSDEMLRKFQTLVSRRIGGRRIRCHGNLGLGELLFTGKDFVIIDFEGEPGRSLGERRVKRSPLGDVATMVRSFHHAALGALLGERSHRWRTPGMIRPEDVAILEPWVNLWNVWVSTAFVREYQAHTAGASFVPASPEDFETLLAHYLLERALRELAYELEERPEWAVISIRGILQLVEQTTPKSWREDQERVARMADVSASIPAALAVTLQVIEEIRRRQVRPIATYRLQLHQGFTLTDAAEVVPYLAELGISHVYCSPYLRAKTGSTHGYDLCDHNEISPDLGGEAAYRQFVAKLQEHGMGHILDMVPNHMAASTQNPWWYDVLENGPNSPYAQFFDIDWHPVKPELADKLLLPILGQRYGQALEERQLAIEFREGAFLLRYFDNELPLSPKTISPLLADRLDELRGELGAEHAEVIELESIITALEHLPPQTARDLASVRERQREKEVVKRRLRDLVAFSTAVRGHIERNIAAYNGGNDDPHSLDPLHRLLNEQAYRLCHWRSAFDEINYRRFFDINELAAIAMELPDVFWRAHGLVRRLLADGSLSGLRIDHIDGLFDPERYLLRLQWAYVADLAQHAFSRLLSEELAAAPVVEENGEAPAATFDKQAEWLRAAPEVLRLLCEQVGLPSLEADDLRAILGPDFPRELPAAEAYADGSVSSAGNQQPLYVLIEKILGPDEPLPETWPTAGTTGYDFVATLNGLFVAPQGWEEIVRNYQRFTDVETPYEQVVLDSKRLILRVAMSSELLMLAHRLNRLSEQHRRSRDLTLNMLRLAAREVLVSFPVYRVYPSKKGVSDRDRRFVDLAVAKAKRQNPAFEPTVFDFVRNVLLLAHPEGLSAAEILQRETLAGRFQQVTSPVMAKGVEDTSFYVWVPLGSVNEVGGDPRRPTTSIKHFHEQNKDRSGRYRQAMLATTTHDTKRTEDVRARLNVLSEIPRDWRAAVQRFSRLNKRWRREVDGEPAPSLKDEYLFYQSALGIWPLHTPTADERATFIQRLQGYMEKATHEAKQRTSWINPSPAYDEAVRQFVAQTLRDSSKNQFVIELQTFCERIADAGQYNALAQVVLKLLAPGVPDIYQGQEFWDNSLVDPDNRRPVDFALRRAALAEVREALPHELTGKMPAPLREPRLKLLVTQRLLKLRQRLAHLWTQGDYVPLEVSGPLVDHVVAFGWRGAESQRIEIVTAVPRFVQKLIDAERSSPAGMPIGQYVLPQTVWAGTTIAWPNGQSLSATNVFTGEQMVIDQPVIEVAALLGSFPVGVLETNPTTTGEPAE